LAICTQASANNRNCWTPVIGPNLLASSCQFVRLCRVACKKV
jgi:hypothetical protein